MGYRNVYYSIKDLKDMSRELTEFLDAVDANNAKMIAEAEDLQSYWNDKQYHEFMRYMEDLSDKVKEQENKLRKSRNDLDDQIVKLLLNY